MAKIQIPYTPRYPGLHARIEAARFFVLVAHRRFGKTVLAINHLIKQALTCKKRAGHFAYVAPFRTQAKAVAWDYLKYYTRGVPARKAHEGELAVTVPSPGGPARIRIFGADLPDSLRGLYFDGVVLDEVAQMKPEVWEEIIQPALADRAGSALFIGTPKGVNLFSRLHHYALGEAARGSSLWDAAAFPIHETEALPAEEVERLRAELSDAKFRQEMLCDFTASADDILISLDDVQAARQRQPDCHLASQWPLVIGVDVARFGQDATVFFPRRGLMALAPTVLRHKSNVDVANLLASHASASGADMLCIDQGQGTGVIDLVKELCPGAIVHEIPFGSQAMASQRFANRRAEMWTAMRDWLKSGGSLPAEHADALAAELTAPRYSYDPSGRIRLEAKEEIARRLKHSTDLADALALTFATRVLPKSQGAPATGSYLANAIYNPFA